MSQWLAHKSEIIFIENSLFICKLPYLVLLYVVLLLLLIVVPLALLEARDSLVC